MGSVSAVGHGDVHSCAQCLGLCIHLALSKNKCSPGRCGDLYLLGECLELSPPAGPASTGISEHWAVLQVCYVLFILLILFDWGSTVF